MDFKRVKVRVCVDVNPTEDRNKVQIAVERTLGEVPLKVLQEGGKERLIGESEGQEALLRFYNLLRREQILDAARKVLFSGLTGNVIRFYLNKQVAYAGHISFSQSVGESPLGPICVEIESDNPRALIDWLTPKTG
ncbi:MAG: hypothetical protein AYL33_000140 [Candidatus Bathyarchaeota archaeon B63]|nr:MAG: hypothetical protein AYL33_000140 [Candidatus Bathyarchaeota archaeon B63]